MKSSSAFALLMGALLLAGCMSQPGKLPVKETPSTGQSSAPSAGAGSAAKATVGQ
jgi:hypothetical protein